MSPAAAPQIAWAAILRSSTGYESENFIPQTLPFDANSLTARNAYSV
jgi:hypothetical protein